MTLFVFNTFPCISVQQKIIHSTLIFPHWDPYGQFKNVHPLNYFLIDILFWWFSCMCVFPQISLPFHWISHYQWGVIHKEWLQKIMKLLTSPIRRLCKEATSILRNYLTIFLHIHSRQRIRSLYWYKLCAGSNVLWLHTTCDFSLFHAGRE